MRPSYELFRRRYGPWALIAGGSEGLGAAFAEALASRGLNLILIARRQEVLSTFAQKLIQKYQVQVESLVYDLANGEALIRLIRSSSQKDVGLLVCNAALAPVGNFLDQPLQNHLNLLNLNCRSAISLAHAFGQRMVDRKSGGIILVSSMAGLQGTATVAHYAASKAYLKILGEGLWAELRPQGVDVLTCCAGLIRTPTFLKGDPTRRGPRALPVMEADRVVAATLSALGKKPVVIPGLINKLASFLTQRLLPRRLVIELAASGTAAVYSKSE
jgi:short-subunit dehydrogenase